jgi:hypothetical protein
MNIPDGVTEIPSYCFYGCSNFKSIKIPHSIISFKNYCFSYCSSLTVIIILDNVTEISISCFDHVLRFNAFIFLFQFEQIKKVLFRLQKVSINITSRKYYSSRCSIFFYMQCILSFVLSSFCSEASVWFLYLLEEWIFIFWIIYQYLLLILISLKHINLISNCQI